MFKNRKGGIEISNTGGFCIKNQAYENGGIDYEKEPVIAGEKFAKDNLIDRKVFRKYKGKPVWVAFDIDHRPVIYEGCISSNVECDYINAHAFIIAQLIKVDSISKFAAMMGEDAHGVEFLRLLNKNDRNLKFWENLAVKWFSAKWMGEQDER